MRLKVLLVLFLIISSGIVNSQTYSSERGKFVKEFQKALSEYGRGEFHDFSKKEFPILLLETNDFPENYFTKMVETCNAMEAKRLKPYPEIYNYVFSVSSFVLSKQPNESYIAWQSSVDKMLESRYVNKFSDFIDLSAGFFSASKIATSSNFEWYYIGGTYEFEYDKKAYIKFENGNLVCRVQSKKVEDKGAIIDSLEVIGANGTYDPILKKWEGEGGKITWEKVGLPKTGTFAKLTRFDLSLKTSTLRVDSVELTTPYFDKPIYGILSDRAFKINRESDKIYPQFLSFQKKLLIEDIVENVDYIGGFSMQGSSFVGLGTNEQQAQITYKRNNVPFIVARSKQILVEPAKIVIQKARTSLFLETGDSITHPGVDFTYDLEKKTIQFVRAKSGIGEAPFEDSYHQLDMYVPKIIWNTTEDNLFFTYEFGTSQEQKIATFESKTYFDAKLYDKLQGLASVHPLVAISKYCYKYDEYVLTEGKAATALGLTISQAKSTLFTLSNLGFINYDPEAQSVTVNKKLETFVKAKAGKKDYDNIVFSSDFRPRSLKGYTDEQIEGDSYLQAVQELYKKKNEERRIKQNFGVMNLATLDLELEAIDNVVISATRNTVVFPSESFVKVKKNRNFDFSGWINSGKLEVNARGAKFDYDEYKFDLLSTDNSLFRVRPIRKEDGIESIPMVSNFTGITGSILIDDTDNRSGNKSGFEHYPILKSVTSSKIFYNSKDIYRGVYDSTRFYYTVEPFEMDSLNGFKESALRLKGELTSAGIFPIIKEDLKIMPDYSFGFSTNAPEGGYKFYGTEATYDNNIVLSNSGLQGSGTINFVHSTSISKRLSFLPDSTVGIAQFENKPIETGVEFPDVQATDAYITYVPKDKVLKAQSTPKNEMTFFNSEARFRGVATVEPKGMKGNGLMTFKSATVESEIFKFKRYDINADTSNFNLRNEQSDELDENALAFKTENVNTDISFKERMGIFKSNEGESTVEFPVNQYMCKMDQFKWFMDELSIEMQKKEEREISIDQGVDLVGPNFYSTHPKQDSLQFRAPKARFDLKQKTIFCEKVEYIDIADARIYPDSMKVVIRKKAKIDKLLNANIVANYITKYHKFSKAEVEVKARRDYEAIGEYPYYDKDSNVTYIMMRDIGLDSSYQTRASGKIASDADFKLSKEFDYYGDVSIKAANPLISFSGATRINHNCVKFDRNWMAFTAEIDPKNIQVPVSESMKNLEGGLISAGIVWRDSPSRDSIQLYPTFLSALVSGDDPIVITSSGYLQYNSATSEFEIASKDKLVNRGEKGNYIALHTESCSMNGEGVINLGMDYGDVEIDAVGVINYNQETGATSMNVTARFDMPIDKGILQDMATRINAIEGLQPMDFNSTTLEQAVIEWEDVKAADKLKDEFIRLGEVKKVPDGLEKAITISGLRLSSYSKDQNIGLITNVESAVLVNMYGKPVMKYVPYKAFFQQIYSKTGGDEFSTFINIPGGRDYFMHYVMDKKDGLLRIKTGDQELSSSLTALKDEKRKIKNFKYESTSNSAFIAKFMALFQ